MPKATEGTIEVHQKKVYQFVAKHPEVTAMEITAALGIPSSRTGYVLKKLRDGKYVKSKGSTKATTYAPTKKLFS
jgi:predicted transcriptional regulator